MIDTCALMIYIYIRRKESVNPRDEVGWFWCILVSIAKWVLGFGIVRNEHKFGVKVGE